MSYQDIEQRFKAHPLDPADKEKLQANEVMRASFGYLATVIEGNVPAGREKFLALTKLEEAMFWTNAAIARHDPPTPEEQPV